MRPRIDRVVREHIVRDDKQLELSERGAGRIGVGQRRRRISPDHPQRLYFTARHGVEHLHCLVTFVRRHPRRVPEAAHAIDALGLETHVRRELVGETANLASTHGVGLAGQ